MIIKLGPNPDTTLLKLDLGEPLDGYYDGGDLADSAGNLYIYADGVEVGSLYFAQGTVTLGTAMGAVGQYLDSWHGAQELFLDGSGARAEQG